MARITAASLVVWLLTHTLAWSQIPSTYPRLAAQKGAAPPTPAAVPAAEEDPRSADGNRLPVQSQVPSSGQRIRVAPDATLPNGQQGIFVTPYMPYSGAVPVQTVPPMPRHFHGQIPMVEGYTSGPVTVPYGHSYVGPGPATVWNEPQSRIVGETRMVGSRTYTEVGGILYEEYPVGVKWNEGHGSTHVSANEMFGSEGWSDSRSGLSDMSRRNGDSDSRRHGKRRWSGKSLFNIRIFSHNHRGPLVETIYHPRNGVDPRRYYRR